MLITDWVLHHLPTDFTHQFFGDSEFLGSNVEIKEFLDLLIIDIFRFI